MPRRTIIASLCAASVTLGASSAVAATARLVGPDGAELGVVTLTETPNGVLLDAELRGLPEGAHGFHIHETGACTPDFAASGGHFAGGRAEHGYMSAGGPHAGDMPNIHVPASGELRIEVFNPAITFRDGPGAIFDADGSAIVIHADPDDYQSQPAGHAGHRIACGVIEE